MSVSMEKSTKVCMINDQTSFTKWQTQLYVCVAYITYELCNQSTWSTSIAQRTTAVTPFQLLQSCTRPSTYMYDHIALPWCLTRVGNWLCSNGTAFPHTVAIHVYALRRHQMESFSTLLALCRGNPPVNSGFPSQKPVTRRFDAFVDVHLNERLCKQLRCRWFEKCHGAHCDICDCRGMMAAVHACDWCFPYLPMFQFVLINLDALVTFHNFPTYWCDICHVDQASAYRLRKNKQIYIFSPRKCMLIDLIST